MGFDLVPFDSLGTTFLKDFWSDGFNDLVGNVFYMGTSLGCGDTIDKADLQREENISTVWLSLSLHCFILYFTWLN
jgi:hypothetical protein